MKKHGSLRINILGKYGIFADYFQPVSYTHLCKAFAQDGSRGEYVFLEDNSIGFIGSEGQVGRVAESLDDLLTFLLHAGCISDFSCQYLYQNTDLLKAFCRGYVSKIRESYQRCV